MMIVYKNHPGYLIVYAIILMFGLMSIGLTVLTITSATYKYAKDDVHRHNAAYMAKACVSVIANELNEDSDFSGFSPANKELSDHTSQGGDRSTCKVDSITDGDGNEKIVRLTSTVYRGDNDSSPVTYKAQALLDSAGDVGYTDHLQGGLLIGYGGMKISSSVTITTSRANILGQLTRTGSGSYIVERDGPLNVFNIACGTTNWPQPCTGERPITRSGGGSIRGDICAPGQPDDSHFDDLRIGCTLPPDVTMPTFDKAGFIAGLTGPEVDGSDIIADGGCYRQSGSNYYGMTYHVPAGATVIGDINLSAIPKLNSGSCRITFDGDVYITGAITGSQNNYAKQAVFTVDSGTPGDIIIVMNRQMFVGDPDLFNFVPGYRGRLAHIINFNSSNTTCSDSTTLPSSTVGTCLTPLEAKTSATDISYAGLRLGGASGNKDLSGMTFYAYYSMFNPNCNGGNFKIAAVAAQGFGGCSSSGSFDLTVNDPTFGIPIPSGGGYYAVDFFQRS